MRFGFILPNILSSTTDAESQRVTGQLAEDTGFDSIWTSDHILVPKQHERYARGTEALMSLAYLAGRTQRVALGITVLILPQRNPILAAKQIASLAHLAGREVIVGVGVGWCAEEYAFLNADFHRRGKLADEYIEIMRKLWTDPDAAHDGTHTFSEALFAPQLDSPPPIWIGGNSEAAIRRAAALAEGYQPHPGATAAEYGARIKRLHELSDGQPKTTSAYMTLDMNDGAQAVIDYLAAYAEAGLMYPALRFNHETLADLTGQMEAFARDVLPVARAF